MAARFTPEVAKVINASYRFTRATRGGREPVDVSGQWPIAAGWYAVGRYNYSFLDGRLLDGLAGFERNAGCWVFRAVAQRVQAAQQVSSTGFFFQLEFNGVGQVGTSDVVQLLTRNVAGYSVTNSRDDALAPPSLRQRLPVRAGLLMPIARVVLLCSWPGCRPLLLSARRWSTASWQWSIRK